MAPTTQIVSSLYNYFSNLIVSIPFCTCNNFIKLSRLYTTNK